MYFFLTNVDGGGSATLGSKMVVPALNVNDTASILALSPEMHQKPLFFPLHVALGSFQPT